MELLTALSLTTSPQLSYIGCYRNLPYNNGTTEYIPHQYRGYDPISCAYKCNELHLPYVYVGKSGDKCACSESPPFDFDEKDMSSCDRECNQNARLACGSQRYQYYSVYLNTVPDQEQAQNWKKLSEKLRDLQNEKDKLLERQEELASVKQEIEELTSRLPDLESLAQDTLNQLHLCDDADPQSDWLENLVGSKLALGKANSTHEMTYYDVIGGRSTLARKILEAQVMEAAIDVQKKKIGERQARAKDYVLEAMTCAP